MHLLPTPTHICGPLVWGTEEQLGHGVQVTSRSTTIRLTCEQTHH